MKSILLINHSDTRGGASVVTRRLMEALCRNGVDARMLTVHSATDDMRIVTAAGPRRARLPFLAEHAGIFMGNGRRRDTLFKISTGAYGLPLHRHPWVQDADAIVLNWVNQGMLSLDGIRSIAALGKPVAWTMHDMWCATGVCHHAGTCQGYKAQCGNCPLLGSSASNKDLSYTTLRNKQRLYADTNIHFVAVSNWLADRCRESTLLAGRDVRVIHNPFRSQDFGLSPTLSRRQLGVPDNGTPLIVMGAARLDDPIKNLPLAIASLNHAHDSGVRATAVFYGALRHPAALQGLRMPHVHLGTVDNKVLPSLYAHAAVVLSTSEYETLPGTLVEGISAGAMAVATCHGGQSDIVKQGVNGWLAGPEDSAEEIGQLLQRAIASPRPRALQHADMAARFDERTIAQQYIKLLLGDKVRPLRHVDALEPLKDIE